MAIDLISNNDEFVQGIHLQMEKERHLGYESAKLAFAVAILTASLAALVLVPHFLQNHSWSQFIEGLKEAKWTLISGSVAGVCLTLIGILYLWQKNREEKVAYLQKTLLLIDKNQVSKKDQQKIKQINKNTEHLFRNLSVVIGITALILFATSLLVAKTDNLLSQISPSDLALGGSIALGSCALAYIIFKSYQIHQTRRIRQKCESQGPAPQGMVEKVLYLYNASKTK